MRRQQRWLAQLMAAGRRASEAAKALAGTAEGKRQPSMRAAMFAMA